MSKLITLLFILVSAEVIVAADPQSICAATLCTDKMEQISEQFAQGNAGFATQPLTGFSGECFHLNKAYDENQAHHGAFSFMAAETKLQAAGIFSFFSQQDPYQDMSSEELQLRFESANQYHSAEVKNDMVHLQYKYPETNIEYWFRTNDDFSKLYLIGQNQSVQSSDYVFCEMNIRN